MPVSHVISVSDHVARKHNISGFFNFKDLCHEHGINLTMLESYQITPEHIPKDVNLMIVNGWNRLIAPDDGKINFNHTAKEIFNLCRALTDPYLGAFGILEGEKWTFDGVKKKV